VSASSTFADASSLCSEGTVRGKPRVVDGDTVEIKDMNIRLEGIDAPESRQTCKFSSGDPYACGVWSTSALKEKIGRKYVGCCLTRKDRYGRYLGYCSIKKKDIPKDESKLYKTLNAWMVSTGQALAYRQYSNAFVSEESYAGENRLGLWEGTFLEPWLWRRNSDGQVTSNCKIKGNISPSGKIYHMPGSTYYDSVSIDTSDGERWFCSEKEALKAGWRAPKDNENDEKSCDIKGNISSSGKIYHVPGGRYYDRVKINTSKGERWFCSEEEAVAAGWRASKY